MTDLAVPASEAVLRLRALVTMLDAMSGDRLPPDPALLSECSRLAGRAVLWATVAAQS